MPFIYCFSSLMSLLTLQFYYLHNIMQRTVIMIYFSSEIVFNLLSSLCHISLKLITPCTIYSFISSSFDQPLFCCASFRLSSSKSHFCLKLVAGVNFKCGAEVLKKNPSWSLSFLKMYSCVYHTYSFYCHHHKTEG